MIINASLAGHLRRREGFTPARRHPRPRHPALTPGLMPKYPQLPARAITDENDSAINLN
jgi:hypothetical protein